MLSESEIKAIMRGCIEASQPKALEMWQEKGGLKEGYAGLLNLMDMLGAVWADALKEAAHAIHERMREGVIHDDVLGEGDLTADLEYLYYTTDPARDVYMRVEVPAGHALESKLAGSRLYVVKDEDD